MVEFELRKTEWKSYNWGILVNGWAPDGWAANLKSDQKEWALGGYIFVLFDLYQVCLFQTEKQDADEPHAGGFILTETEQGIALEYWAHSDLYIETTYSELRTALEDLFRDLFEIMDQNTMSPGREEALEMLDDMYDFDVSTLYDRVTEK